MWNCELKTKRSNPVNTAQKMASQSSTKQNGEATTEEVPGSIVTYTEEEINTFKDDKFENKCKNKHKVQKKLSNVQTCTTDLASYLLTQCMDNRKSLSIIHAQ